MPSRSILPTSEEFFTSMFVGDRDEILQRPPWGCVATPELSIDWLGVHPQTLWNYRLRCQGPEAEENARRLYRRVGRRTLYRFESVLSWLPGGADRPIHSWSRRWLEAMGHAVADDPSAVLHRIALVESNPRVKARPYGFRKLDLGLARLAVVYGVRLPS
jgi:hypothetical protein